VTSGYGLRMIGVRTLARSLLASMFVVGGLNSLRRPKRLAPVVDELPDAVVPDDVVALTPEQLVKVNGAVQVVGGAMLVFDVLPRVGALALAGSLVPTTLAAHRFWEAEGDERTTELIHFLKNAGLLGGLLFAALDTGGRPSIFWSTKRAADAAVSAVGSSASHAFDAVTP
jgi:putative oxidoreductase